MINPKRKKPNHLVKGSPAIL